MFKRKSRPSAPESAVETSQPRCEPPSGDGGASLVFWMLITLALVVMAPCMILPAWREYQAADLLERTRAAEARAVEEHAERLERRLDAIHNDPVVIARLARRELRCTLPGEVRLAVGSDAWPDADYAAAGFSRLEVRPSGPSAGGAGVYAELFRERTPPAAEVDKTPVAPPVVVARLTQYLPRLNYDELFCTSPTRETLLGMSVLLVVAAFTIFWPRLPKQ